MGFKQLNIKMPTGYTPDDVRNTISKLLKIPEFTFQIENQSLDARNKKNIFWQIRVGVHSKHINEGKKKERETIKTEYKKKNKKIAVAGSGPAGFFAAFILQKSGFDTIIFERGTDVDKRSQQIKDFEKNGDFNDKSNYAFGEGGAGTFSDGKLTSRSKHISRERNFIIESYINAGAPKEISYLAHPHIGSDNLKKIVKNLRKEYENIGGKILFETSLDDILVQKNIVQESITSEIVYKADYYIIASGHSSFDTYRMLMNRGIPFRTKNFAIGFRAEHHQEIINRAQWGVPDLEGVKAAEYRLTSTGNGKNRVYSFCMCPGGKVVPAMAYKHTNIVNGMSNYNRNGRFANAACVTAIHPDELAGKKTLPLEALQYLEEIEQAFYHFNNSYRAPFCTILNFLNKKEQKEVVDSSYPLELIPAPLWQMLPGHIIEAIKKGLYDFSGKLKGYDQGILIGLESKTSSPVQVIREKNGLVDGFQNLFVIGEGSGYAGGIISSAADGVKTALHIIERG